MVKQEYTDRPLIPGSEQFSEGLLKSHVLDFPYLKDANVFPQLHATLNDWEVVTNDDAAPYLPLPREPVTVTLGIRSLTTTSLPAMEATDLNNYMKYKHGYLINTGNTIQGLDFAPKTTSMDTHPTIHYLATGGYKEAAKLDCFDRPPQGYPNCIQLWKCDLATEKARDEQPTTTTTTSMMTAPALDVCLLHDFGHVRDLRWCPYGAYEEKSDQGIPKLGVLAASFGDGSVHVMVIPHPDALPRSDQSTVYLKIKQSRCSIRIPDTLITTLAWGGHKKLAVGSASGMLALVDMEGALNPQNEMDARDAQRSARFVIFSVALHDAGIQAIAWHGLQDPVNLVTVGNDAKLNILDIRDPFIPMNLFRLRTLMYCVAWPGYMKKLCYMDGDLLGKDAQLADSKDFKAGQFFVDPSGILLSIASSEQHSFLVHSSNDGYVKMNNTFYQRTKRTPRVTPVVYKLIYDEYTDTYRYVDGLTSQPVGSAKLLQAENLTLSPRHAINKVCWNHNSQTAAWMASGGTNGLCRLDFIGLGEDWD